MSGSKQALGSANQLLSPFALRKLRSFAERKATMEHLAIRPSLLSGLAISLVLVASGRCGEQAAPRCTETPCESHVRAGCPQVVSPYARPSVTPNYCGYYVGGGAAIRGQPRCADEGTWGWDYGGVFPKWVALNWWHGAQARRRRSIRNRPQVMRLFSRQFPDGIELRGRCKKAGGRAGKQEQAGAIVRPFLQ